MSVVDALLGALVQRCPAAASAASMTEQHCFDFDLPFNGSSGSSERLTFRQGALQDSNQKLRNH